MAEAPPTITTSQLGITTLISIEKSWLGEKVTGEAVLLRGDAKDLHVYHVTSQRILKQLKTKLTGIETYYAVCTGDGCIVYFAGMDVEGEALRYYDIVGMHRPSHPAANNLEVFCDTYINVLSTRVKSRRRFLSSYDRDEDAKIRRYNEDKLDKNCLEWVQGETVRYMNRYFGTIQDNTSTVVMKRVPNIQEGTIIVGLKYSGFINSYIHLSLPGDKNSISTMWYKHKDKRVYEGIGFGDDVPPNYLNYWTGLRKIPEGTTSVGSERCMEYLHMQLCAGNTLAFKYLSYYLASLVQDPLTKKNVCITSVGGQGVGKNTLPDGILKPIFGKHYVRVTMDELKRFNGCLKHAIIALFDEAIPENDKQALGKYKALITSPMLRVEDKFLSSYELPNRVNPIVVTNWDLGGLIEHDDRRQLVLRPSSQYADLSIPENAKYWTDLYDNFRDNIDNIHQAFREISLDGFDLRVIPITNVKRDHKLASLCSVHDWLIDILRTDNTILPWSSIVAKSILYARYLEWMKNEQPQERVMVSNRFWSKFKQFMENDYEEIPHRNPHPICLPTQDKMRQIACRFMRDNELFG